jgi:radical SAM superfamily enzyme YgiQ (UPF0313 family)
MMRVVLISTYDLGHQPFGLASPAAWLARAGAEVTCVDLAVGPLDEMAVAAADLVAFYVPMHTATRLAARALERVKRLNPHAHLCFYGLYAPVNEDFLRQLGVQTILGGEFEGGLVALVRRLAADDGRCRAAQAEPVISLDRQDFMVPDRGGLAGLDRYAYLTLPDGERRIAGYTEASRGCKHTCRHCPVVPVYGGRFRVVAREVVLDDIAQQVAAGAQHITFGDPDFLNGPGHAFPLVRALHERWTSLSYDVTIKIEHLLKHADELPLLRDTGCVLVTSAVEAVDDRTLELLDKRHTRADVVRTVALLREAGLALNPTFVPFTPWTSLDGYLDLLATIQGLDLVENVTPIQYAIRLLIPSGSRLLELAATREIVGPFDGAQLCYPWQHPDPAVDALHARVMDLVSSGLERGRSRAAIFGQIWQAASDALYAARRRRPEPLPAARSGIACIPHLSEPWYC